MARKQKKTDEDISILLKNKLVEMIDRAKDPATVVALTTSFAKLRAMELKADEGEFGEGLDSDTPSSLLDVPATAPRQ